MSICNECWGKGWIEKQGVQFDCRKCKGTGVIENEPQTKEEWFCQLPTEEKAEFLANYFMFDCPMVDKVFQKQEAHNFIGLEKLAKETILEWLKEKYEE